MSESIFRAIPTIQPLIGLYFDGAPPCRLEDQTLDGKNVQL